MFPYLVVLWLGLVVSACLALLGYYLAVNEVDTRKKFLLSLLVFMLLIEILTLGVYTPPPLTAETAGARLSALLIYLGVKVPLLGLAVLYARSLSVKIQRAARFGQKVAWVPQDSRTLRHNQWAAERAKHPVYADLHQDGSSFSMG